MLHQPPGSSSITQKPLLLSKKGWSPQTSVRRGAGERPLRILMVPKQPSLRSPSAWGVLGAQPAWA